MKPLSRRGVRNALVVAPHPDDETIGAYGLIRSLRLRAARVRVVVVTDGAGSHRNSVLWPTRRLVAERRRETLLAMRRIGVNAGDVRFLGLPDGDLEHQPKSVERSLRHAVAQSGPIDLIALPAADDDHPDHRSVAVASRLWRARKVHYLVWPNRHASSRPASHTLRLGALAHAKRGAIRRYRTQMGAITDDPTGFAISRAELAAFSKPAELFREVRR